AQHFSEESTPCLAMFGTRGCCLCGDLFPPGTFPVPRGGLPPVWVGEVRPLMECLAVRKLLATTSLTGGGQPVDTRSPPWPCTTSSNSTGPTPAETGMALRPTRLPARSI